MNKHSADATTAEEALAIQETLDSNMATEVAMKNTLLTPRFYTTDFDELDAVDVSHIKSEWDPLIERMLSDPNKGHFKKNDDWDQVDWDNMEPQLKKEFIDTGLISIEYKNFPLDMAALNASKLSHCKNDGNSELLHHLYLNQKKWAKGSTINEINSNLNTTIKEGNYKIDTKKCFANEVLEDHILNDRVEAVKKYDVNSTPTIIINEKKFEKPLTFKNLQKAIEKLL